MRIAVTANIGFTVAAADEDRMRPLIDAYLLAVAAVCVAQGKALGYALEWYWEGVDEFTRIDYRFNPRRVLGLLVWHFCAAYDLEADRDTCEEAADRLVARIEAELCNVKAAFHHGPVDEVEYHAEIDKFALRWSA